VLLNQNIHLNMLLHKSPRALQVFRN